MPNELLPQSTPQNPTSGVGLLLCLFPWELAGVAWQWGIMRNEIRKICHRRLAITVSPRTFRWAQQRPKMSSKPQCTNLWLECNAWHWVTAG